MARQVSNDTSPGFFMAFRGEIPAYVKIRVWKNRGRYYVLQRDGEGWESMVDFPTEDEALEVIEQHFADKDARWSLGVKVRAGWVCEEPGCGEGVGGDKTLLEAHHIEPVAICPTKRNDPTNGRCLCLFHHASKHTGWARLTILARLALVLYGRLYPHKKAEIERMVL